MVRAEKVKSMKRLIADRFPCLFHYYLHVRTPYRQAVYINRFIKYLNREHPEICVSLLDVGARGGLNAVPIFRPLKHLKNRLIHGIEPDTKEAERLRKSGEYDHVFTDGVAWYNGETVLHVPPEDPSSASIRKPDPVVEQQYFVQWRSIDCREYPIRVKKLSSILPTGTTYDFIKTDVEGCDYDVLASAEPGLLERALCVVCETQSVPIFVGQHAMSQLDTFLREKRFLPYSIKLQHRFINYDVIYVKDPRMISDLKTLLKYILLGTFLRHRDSFISDVLHIYKARFGKKRALDIIYKLTNGERI